MKYKKKDLVNISKLMPFSDTECGMLQYFIGHYVIENENKLTSRDGYTLGVFGSNLQYSIRLVNSIILGNDIVDSDMSLVKQFINISNTYDDLISFIIKTFIEYYNNMSPLKQFEYKIKDSIKCIPLSYFSKSEEEIKECEKDIYKVLKKLKC